MCIGCIVKAFEKVSWESCLRNLIVAALTNGNVVYVAATVCYHCKTLCITEQRYVFLHNYNKKMLHQSCRMLHQIAMSKCKGVGIHHYRTNHVAIFLQSDLFTFRTKIIFICSYRLPATFHQYRLFRRGKRSKRHALEHTPVAWFGEYSHAVITIAYGMTHKVRYQSAAKAFLTHILIYGNALYDIS